LLRSVTPSGLPRPATWIAFLVGGFFLYLTFPLLQFRASGLSGLAEFLGAMVRVPDWSYLPVLAGLLGETIAIAILGTVPAVLLSLPLSLFAARNTTPHVAVSWLLRLVCSAVRAIPELVWVLLLAGLVGLGVVPGVLALIITSVSFLVRAYAESLEVVDPKAIEGVAAQGASWLGIRTFAVLPQAAPDLIGLSLYWFDVNLRMSTILGMVGAGGLGLAITQSAKLFKYERLGMILISVYLLVTLVDRASAIARRRLVG